MKHNFALHVEGLAFLNLPTSLQGRGSVQHGLLPEGPSHTSGDVKLEDTGRVSVSGDESEQNGQGRKRRRKGKDRKAVQPVRSYPTRERAKAEAEVVAEVSLATPCYIQCLQQHWSAMAK